MAGFRKTKHGRKEDAMAHCLTKRLYLGLMFGKLRSGP